MFSVFVTLTVIQFSGLLGLVVYCFVKSKNVPILEERDLPSISYAPKVSVILCVKNEEKRIVLCVNSLLSQSYKNLEIVIVNDRSDDNSQAVLEVLQKKNPLKIKLVHVKDLPAGWGGQNHGIYQGVKHSTGSWLCLTDADCVFLSNNFVALSVDAALSCNEPFISVLPRLSASTIWEKFYLPVFSFIHSMRLGILNVNDKKSQAAYANGSFMLLERGCYDRLGGHEIVKSVINDDTRLAKLSKMNNIGLRLYGNRGLYETEMYSTISSAWSGWTRNTYSSLYEGCNLFLTTAAVLFLALTPWLVMIGLLALNYVSGIDLNVNISIWSVPLIVSHLVAALIYSAYGFNPWWSVSYFFASVFSFFILLNCIMKLLTGSSIWWHGVEYPAPKKITY